MFWIAFQQHGKTVKQSTGTRDKAKAKAFLEQQAGKVALKIPVNVQADRLTLTDGAAMIREDYTTNGRKSADTVEYRLRHVLAHFGATTRLSRVTTGAVEAYVARRLAESARPGTVNRELACLARMGSLAHRKYGLLVPFVVTNLEERNARQGFFEPEDFDAICTALPPHLAALARAAYLTGWRKSELRSRQWAHVDFAHGVLRLDPEESKNRQAREFPLIPELRALLEAQRVRVEAIERTTHQIVPWVFARPNGGPPGDFKQAWATACIQAGFFRVVLVRGPDGTPRVAKDGTPVTVKKPTKLVHDCRRTAARSLIRAGVPEVTAMALLGHATNAIFKRYAIVDEGMRREAGDKLTAYHADVARRQPGGRVVALRPSS